LRGKHGAEKQHAGKGFRMASRAKEILAEALALPPEERAELMDQLFASFEATDRQRIDALWGEEAEDRIDAYERGELGAKPAREVLRHVQ
jgi:hypothetical protein